MLRISILGALLGVCLCTLSATAAVLVGGIDLAIDDEGTPYTRASGGTGDGMGVGNQNLAVADFNGDGLDDYAVGFAGYDPDPESAGTDFGRVIIVYGGDQPESLDLGTVPTGTVITNLSTSANFGYALAAGDVTDDGLPDLVIGAPLARGGLGVVTVLFNSQLATPGASIDVNTDDADPTSGETRFVGVETGGADGTSVACADLSGDGAFEVIGGAPNAGVGASVSNGRVYVAFGANVMAGMTLNISSEPELYEILGVDGAQLGTSLAAGDIDGNGIDELLVGAFEESKVYGFFNVGPGPITMNLSDSGVFPMILRLSGYASLGQAIAVGDVNLDGFEDLLLGIPLYSPSAERSQAGGAVFYRGRANLQGQNVDWAQPFQVPNAFFIGGELGQEVGGQRAGASVALGDLNGDGRADLCLGAPFVKSITGELNAGSTAVIYGSASPAGVDFFELSADLLITGAGTNDFTGGAINLDGDLNGDGYADLLHTSPFDQNGAGDGSGRVDTLYGDGSASSASATIALVSGDTQRQGLGGELSPVLRVSTQFSSGTSSTATATLTRSTTSLSNLGNGLGTNLARVFWNLSTTRTLFTNVALNLEYTDAEIDGLSENALAVYQAPAPEGPWTEVAGQAHEPNVNRFDLNVTSLGYFAIVSEVPVITLNGGDIVSECGDFTYEEPGYVATAADGTDLTDQVIVSGGPIPVAVGETTLTYTVEDGMGVPAEPRTRTIELLDTQPPFVLSNSFDDFFCGQQFDIRDYFNVIDDCAGDLTEQVVISGDTVDFFTPGEYQILLDVSDPSGNVMPTVAITISINSEVPPNIELEGENPVVLPCGTPFVEPGYSASDVCFGDLTSAVEVTGTVDENVPGSYELFYELTNAAQLVAFTRSRTVQITGPCAVEGEGEGVAEGEGTAEGEGAVDGEGTAEGEGEGELDPLLACAGESVFSQTANPVPASATGIQSETGDNIGYDQFQSVSGPIGGLQWWGIDPANRQNLSFRINFYADGASPGQLLYSFVVLPQVTPTNLTVLSRTLLRYEAELPATVPLSSGWISIAGSSNPSGNFNWYGAGGSGTSRLGPDNDLANTTIAFGNRAFCLMAADPYKVLLSRFAELDTNDDGKLSLEECQALLPGFSQNDFDQANENNEGGLSVGELLEKVGGGILNNMDTNGDREVTLSELLRVLQLYNAGGYACGPSSGFNEDGYVPRPQNGSDPTCVLHAIDLNEDNVISLSELLRAIQFYNLGNYTYCPGTGAEDDFCL